MAKSHLLLLLSWPHSRHSVGGVPLTRLHCSTVQRDGEWGEGHAVLAVMGASQGLPAREGCRKRPSNKHGTSPGGGLSLGASRRKPLSASLDKVGA